MAEPRYHCPGFILKPVARDEYELCHSPRSTLSTTLDGKGLEFLLYFTEPSTPADAIGSFAARGWDLAPEVYADVLEQLIAGHLLVVAAEDAAPTPVTAVTPEAAPAEAGSRIDLANPDDAGAIAVLHDQLMTDIERKRLAAEGKLGLERGPLLDKIATLSEELRALLSVIVTPAVSRGERRQTRAQVAKRFDAYYAALTPLDENLAGLVAAGYIVDHGVEVEVAIPADETFLIFEKLRAELETAALRHEWRLRQASAESMHLVAREAGEVVGYLEGRYLLHDKVYDEAEIVTLIVAEKARKGGLGAKLVREFQRLATEKRVWLGKVPTQITNTRGIAFYQREGFRIVEGDIYLSWVPPMAARGRK